MRSNDHFFNILMRALPYSPLPDELQTLHEFDISLVFTSCRILLQMIDPELKFPKT